VGPQDRLWGPVLRLARQDFRFGVAYVKASAEDSALLTPEAFVTVTLTLPAV
jgi:hypothetical protein